jgi:hypothetical protein
MAQIIAAASQVENGSKQASLHVVLMAAVNRFLCENGAFAVESFLKNNYSATQRQREFRKHCNSGRNGKVPIRQKGKGKVVSVLN